MRVDHLDGHNAGSVRAVDAIAGDARALEAAAPSVDFKVDRPLQLASENSVLPRRRRRSTSRDAIPTIIEFVENTEWLGLVISPAQRVLLKAIYGLPLEGDEEVNLWVRCTGRPTYRSGVGFAEVTIVAGARSGKDSRIAAPIVLYEAIFGGHVVARGEVGVFPLFAQNQKATEVAFDYIVELGRRTRVDPYVDDEKGSELVLHSATGQPMKVICFPCSSKSVRGFSVPAAVMDEVAFFRADSGRIVDKEVQRAIRRGMVGFTRRRLVKISTPSTQVGVLYEDFARYWGKDDATDVLVWHAPTTLMNPSITEADLAEDRRKDPIAARREYDAEFIGDDATAYLAQAWLESARAERRYELGPVPATAYRAGVDPSGGAGDEFALAIVHVDGHRLVQDVSQAWGSSRTGTVPLDSDGGVVDQIVTICRRFGIGTVHGDHFSGKWVVEAFARRGISYKFAEPKKRAYQDMKPAFQQGRVAVLDDGVLLGQLAALQETWEFGSKVPIVDHPRGGHDDRANALAIVVADFMRSMNPGVTVTTESLRREQEARGATATPDSPAALMQLWARGGTRLFDDRRARFARTGGPR